MSNSNSESGDPVMGVLKRLLGKLPKNDFLRAGVLAGVLDVLILLAIVGLAAKIGLSTQLVFLGCYTITAVTISVLTAYPFVLAEKRRGSLAESDVDNILTRTDDYDRVPGVTLYKREGAEDAQ